MTNYTCLSILNIELDKNVSKTMIFCQQENLWFYEVGVRNHQGRGGRSAENQGVYYCK